MTAEGAGEKRTVPIRGLRPRGRYAKVMSMAMAESIWIGARRFSGEWGRRWWNGRGTANVPHGQPLRLQAVDRLPA
jgi:hypothetical protein